MYPRPDNYTVETFLQLVKKHNPRVYSDSVVAWNGEIRLCKYTVLITKGEPFEEFAKAIYWGSYLFEPHKVMDNALYMIGDDAYSGRLISVALTAFEATTYKWIDVWKLLGSDNSFHTLALGCDRGFVIIKSVYGYGEHGAGGVKFLSEIVSSRLTESPYRYHAIDIDMVEEWNINSGTIEQWARELGILP